MMNDIINELNQIPNIAQFIADRIETMILKGDILPGTRLVQNEIADQFGVSRLPVRDAFAILYKKNLIKQLPRKGMVVRSIDLKEIEDLFEYRLLLETYAIRKSLPAFTEEMVGKAENLLKQQAEIDETDLLKILEVDEKFHAHLWSGMNNQEVLTALEGIWRRLKIIRAFARIIPNWRERSVQGHREIVDSIRKKDYTSAIKQLEKGIKRSQKEIIDELKKLELS